MMAWTFRYEGSTAVAFQEIGNIKISPVKTASLQTYHFTVFNNSQHKKTPFTTLQIDFAYLWAEGTSGSYAVAEGPNQRSVGIRAPIHFDEVVVT